MLKLFVSNFTTCVTFQIVPRANKTGAGTIKSKMAAARNPEIIVTSFRLPFGTVRRDNGTVGRSESRDEWARSLAHVVTQSRGQWVGWAGIALQRGQPVPSPDPGDTSPTAHLTASQVDSNPVRFSNQAKYFNPTRYSNPARYSNTAGH